MIDTQSGQNEKENDQIVLSSPTETHDININNNNNANNNTNNFSNEIDIRTGKVYTTNNRDSSKRIPSSIRTNSITFHGYGLENNHGAPNDSQHRNSVVSNNMHSSESVFLEEEENQDTTDGKSNSDNGSSFLVKAIKRNMTRSRKDSQESAESWNSSSDEESDYEDSTVIANHRNNTVDKTDNFMSNITEHAAEEEKVQLQQPKLVRPTRQNTLITRPTHPPPKPPVASSKSNPNSLESLHELETKESAAIPVNESTKDASPVDDDSNRSVVTKEIPLTDSLKKKVAPIKPQRPSLLRLKNVTGDSQTGTEVVNNSPRQKSPPSHPPPPPPTLESPLGSEMIDMINFERRKSQEDETEKFEKDSAVDS